MSTESSPLLRQESDARRTLQDRIVDVFRPNSRSPAGFEPAGQGIHSTQGLGITGDSHDRARLLESYDSSDPVCGERRCSHGTFSPRPQASEQQSYLETAGGQFGYGGIGNSGAASGGDDPLASRPESDYTSQMKSSTALSMNEHQKLYAICHGISQALVLAHIQPNRTTQLTGPPLGTFPTISLSSTGLDNTDGNSFVETS
jgi:hypothetical protein